MIGYYLHKVMGYFTRLKECAKCEAGHDPADHDCRRNYFGSAKFMEADMSSELVNRNPSLDRDNVQISTTFADDDASTISTIRKDALHEIEKWSDLNHATGCFVKAIDKVPSLRDQGTIDDLEYMFSIAIRTHKDDVEGVRKVSWLSFLTVLVTTALAVRSGVVL